MLYGRNFGWVLEHHNMAKLAEQWYEAYSDDIK